MPKERMEEIRTLAETGQSRKMEILLRQSLDEGVAFSEILEKALVPAMRNAGMNYKNNDNSLMQIMTTARCVQKGMDILLPWMEQCRRYPLGKIILGTVEGDLHDVGKNLVSMMMQTTGFEVIDLGVDVTGKRFVQAAKQHPDANIVCLSCLLTTSMPAMKRTVRMFKEDRELSHICLMVGGNPVTQSFATSIGADVYTENAVDAADTAKRIIQEQRKII